MRLYEQLGVSLVESPLAAVPMKSILLRTIGLLLLFGVALACLADSLTYLRIDQSVIEKRIATVPANDKERINTIRAQFRAAGCAPNQIQEQAIPGGELPNVICTLPGALPGVILIASRLDSQAHGDEARVDWGSVAMLPLLAESLNSAPHQMTLVLAAFAGHDHDQAGADWYLKQLNEQERTRIEAMVEIEKPGRSVPAYAFPGPEAKRIVSTGRRSAYLQASAHPPTTLTKVLPIAARSLKFPQEPIENDDVSATEARVFDEAKIPAIVIHSPSYTTVTAPSKTGSVRMVRTSLDPQIYTDTYNLLCVYTLYLDKVFSMARARQLATQTAQASPTPQNGDSVGPAPPSSGMTATNTATGTTTPSPSAAEAHVKQPVPAAETAPSNPTFRTTARLVQVDVVVTDKRGRPIPGLTQSDFTVFQDGKPQPVRVFEPHTGTNGPAGTASSAAEKPRLAPNTYSNHPGDAAADSWTIVLFDLLNTPTTDQVYARKQLLDLLRTAPKGQPIALYLLASKLLMMQGFTDDPDKLLKAANMLDVSRSHVLTTEAQHQHDSGQITYAATELTSSAPASLTSGNNAIQGEIIQNMQQQLRDLETFQIGDRASFTLAAFQSLARAVSGYPGRKNVIWLSAAFPIQLMADPKMESQPWRNAANYRNVLAQASSLLAQSRVAVYPVDVRGLQQRGVDISTSASEVGAYTLPQNSQASGDLISSQTASYADERSTMMEVAQQTGGQAFLGTNDLKLAMKRSMDDGATYYTLAYTPSEVDPKTVFHRIEVKVNHPDVKLAYRRGYYSAPQKAGSPETGIAALHGALQPGMPQSTMLFMTAMVLPPDASHKNVRIQYIINPNGVTFADVADQGKRVTVDCMAIAYYTDGREAGHASDTLDGTIKAQAYDTVMNNGLPAQQELTLPPGAYNLRLGVMDAPSQQIGTVDVPLVVPEGTSAKN